jgi:hypothetical protein
VEFRGSARTRDGAVMLDARFAGATAWRFCGDTLMAATGVGFASTDTCRERSPVLHLARWYETQAKWMAGERPPRQRAGTIFSPRDAWTLGLAWQMGARCNPATNSLFSSVGQEIPLADVKT